VPIERRRKPRTVGRAKRGFLRAGERHDAWSERPARWHGRPRRTRVDPQSPACAIISRGDRPLGRIPEGSPPETKNRHARGRSRGSIRAVGPRSVVVLFPGRIIRQEKTGVLSPGHGVCETCAVRCRRESFTRSGRRSVGGRPASRPRQNRSRRRAARPPRRRPRPRPSPPPRAPRPESRETLRAGRAGHGPPG